MLDDVGMLYAASSADFTFSASAPKPAGSLMAMSDRTLRSISIPAFFRPCMNTLYDIPCWCAPALMRTIHSFRKSRFLFLRSRYAYFQPRSTFSFAAFHSLLRAPNAPRAAFITCFLRFRRATFDLTRGIYLLRLRLKQALDVLDFAVRLDRGALTEVALSLRGLLGEDVALEGAHPL